MRLDALISGIINYYKLLWKYKWHNFELPFLWNTPFNRIFNFFSRVKTWKQKYSALQFLPDFVFLDMVAMQMLLYEW